MTTQLTLFGRRTKSRNKIVINKQYLRISLHVHTCKLYTEVLRSLTRHLITQHSQIDSYKCIQSMIDNKNNKKNRWNESQHSLKRKKLFDENNVKNSFDLTFGKNVIRTWAKLQMINKQLNIDLFIHFAHMRQHVRKFTLEQIPSSYLSID